MDIRGIDERDPIVSFDLLKSWAFETFGREVGEKHTPTCGWQALAVGLQHGGMLEAQSATIDVKEMERALRLRIVSAYSRMRLATVRASLARKCEDTLSFFHLRKYESIHEATAHWSWYLYCMTFALSDVKSGADTTIAYMPLDGSDLSIAACLYEVQITVSRMLEPPLRFVPSVGTKPKAGLHLLLRLATRGP